MRSSIRFSVIASWSNSSLRGPTGMRWRVSPAMIASAELLIE
jgi:hypothetical protein